MLGQQFCKAAPERAAFLFFSLESRFFIFAFQERLKHCRRGLDERF